MTAKDTNFNDSEFEWWPNDASSYSICDRVEFGVKCFSRYNIVRFNSDTCKVELFEHW